MKKPYRNIKILVICSALSIVLSLVLSVICAFLVELLCKKNVFSILSFFAAAVILNIVNYFIFNALINRENKRHKKYLILKLQSNDITEILNQSNATQIFDNVYAFAFDRSMLDTVSAYILDENSSEQDIKTLRDKTQQYFKQNYECAAETSPSKKHHRLNVQLYIVKQKTNVLNDMFVCKGGAQLFSVGFIRAILSIDDAEIVLPFYTGKEMEISSLRNYDKSVALLCKLFGITEMSEKD